MDPIWTDSCSFDLNELSSSAADTSFVIGLYEEEDDNEFKDELYDLGDDERATGSQSIEENTKKLNAGPHKKRKVIQSQMQSIGQIAASLERYSTMQSARHKEQLEV